MTSTGSAEITHLLKAWSEGDHTALERLAPEVYEQLRRELIAVDGRPAGASARERGARHERAHRAAFLRGIERGGDS